MNPLRNLVLILGDQLDVQSNALTDFDPAQDRVLMIESNGEGKYVWSHKARIALFLSAMRHFGQDLVRRGLPLDYKKIENNQYAGFAEALEAALRESKPRKLIVLQPGEWRMQEIIREVCKTQSIDLALRDDGHFFISPAEFAQWAKPYKQIRMENFYRVMRRRTGVLMDGEAPAGGMWNYDAENRSSFGKQGPGLLPAPPTFEPDRITRDVFRLVEQYFPDHPGSLDAFNWPVTRDDALVAMQDFVEHRLQDFGRFQDAMWQGEPFLHHALLSSSLNLKLLNPREVVAAAEQAGKKFRLPLAAVEGFIRQILGWREFIRGMYWLDMPALAEANHFNNRRDLPAWYWSGDTQMHCMRETVTQTMRHGYAHHIQRLMVTGMFGILAEIEPRQLAAWYLAVYVDAIEWVELPNVAGMALYANGGRFTSKPYVASGAYINRMSNYCSGCRYKPDKKIGDDACPVTALYWHFLDKHEKEFSSQPRTALMVKNLQRLSDGERHSIRENGDKLLNKINQL
ncbi:MAG: cryptochrome/photolyase family protein [Burkholderiales bacterium]